MDANDVTAARHQRYMKRCIELANIALSENNTPVGSVVVLNGEIIGEGSEELPSGTNITGHAEAMACQKAVEGTGSRTLLDATLYSTAEPCFMCSYLIRQCRIGLLVYGVETPDIGGVTSCYPILTSEMLSCWAPPLRVIAGVLVDECQRLQAAK